MNAVLDWAAALDPRLVLLSLIGVLNLWATGVTALSRAPAREKMLWVAVIFLCPIVGSVLWFVFGPKLWAERR